MREAPETPTETGGTAPLGTYTGVLPVVLCLAVLAAVMCWAAYVPAQAWVNQDVAMNLFSGTEILRGAALYVDWHDTNPPAIHLLSASLVAVARGAQLPAVLVYHLFVLGLFASSAVLLVRNLRTFGPRRVAVLMLAFGAVLVSPTLLRFEDFGQREHMWLILFVPIVILRIHSLDDRSRHFQIHAFFLGLASGFKPHFLLLVVLAEWLLHGHSRRGNLSSRLAVCAGWLAPICVLAFLCPRSAVGMFRDGALTIATYAHLGRPPLHQALLSRWAILAFSCTAAAWVSVWRLGEDGRISTRAASGVRTLLLVNLGCVFLQGKFLDYHWIPSIGLAFVLFVWFTVNSRRSTLQTMLPVGVLALLGVSLFNVRTMFQPYQPRFPFNRLIRKSEKIMLFSTSIWAIRPLYLDGATLIGPWFMHFALPALVRDGVDERHQALLASIRTDIQAKLDAREPELLMFEEPEHWFLQNGQTISGLVSRAGIHIPACYVELSDQDLQSCCGGRHDWRLYRRH